MGTRSNEEHSYMVGESKCEILKSTDCYSFYYVRRRTYCTSFRQPELSYHAIHRPILSYVAVRHLHGTSKSGHAGNKAVSGETCAYLGCTPDSPFSEVKP